MDHEEMMKELKELLETNMGDLDDLEIHADALDMIGELERDMEDLKF